MLYPRYGKLVCVVQNRSNWTSGAYSVFYSVLLHPINWRKICVVLLKIFL